MWVCAKSGADLGDVYVCVCDWWCRYRCFIYYIHTSSLRLGVLSYSKVRFCCSVFVGLIISRTFRSTDTQQGDSEYVLLGYTDVLNTMITNKKTVKRKVTDLYYATTSSREWRTVGTPTTDWEMSLSVYLRKKRRLIQSGRLVKSSEAIIWYSFSLYT